MKIIPRRNQILIKPKTEESKVSEFGILTPNNVEQEQKAIGVVVEVGKDINDIEKGDTVIHGAYVGEKISIKEKGKDVEYILLLDEDVLAFLVD